MGIKENIIRRIEDLSNEERTVLQLLCYHLMHFPFRCFLQGNSCHTYVSEEMR